jgi:putative transposase
MEVSRSGFYKYLEIQVTKQIDQDFELISKVKEIFVGSRGSYGARRIAKKLSKDGQETNRHQARKLMFKAGVSVKAKRKFKVTTDSKHNLPVAKNILNRNFDVKLADMVWCTDITYLWTRQGWLFLAVVIDLFSRKIVGWSIDTHMRVSLVKDALKMAWWKRKPGKDLIHHSDSGSQYASHEYQDLLNEYRFISSMSRKGNCWDNAVVERFFRSLKTEQTNHYRYVNREAARRDVVDYILMFYNSQRLHSTLGYRSPADFEAEYQQLQNVA